MSYILGIYHNIKDVTLQSVFKVDKTDCQPVASARVCLVLSLFQSIYILKDALKINDKGAVKFPFIISLYATIHTKKLMKSSQERREFCQ